MTNVKAFFLILLPIWLLIASETSYARHAAVLIDAENGSILYEQEAGQAWFPASLTKTMTLYMTFEALRAGRISLYDDMETSGHAAAQPQSKLGLRRGEFITVEEAILAIITRSANDASVVLAERLAGTEESFAINMTAKAHQIGMFNTHFMNATGLPHDWQVTTARDMGLMAWRVFKTFPEYFHYFSAHSMTFRDRELHAINKFTSNYPGADGMKTGFTCGSGYNLIGSASQDGKRMIGVIMGGMTSGERYELMMEMMDEGFANQFGPRGSITTPSTRSAGLPPYQLGCGKRHTNLVAHTEDDEPVVLNPRTRYKRAAVIPVAPPVKHIVLPPVRLAHHHEHVVPTPIKLAKPIKSAKVHEIAPKHGHVKEPSVVAHKAGKAAAKPSHEPVKAHKEAASKPVAKAKPEPKAAKSAKAVKAVKAAPAKAAAKKPAKGKK